MKLSILSPERRLLEGLAVSEVTLTGSEGMIQVLPGHAAMIGTLGTGAFRYMAPGKGEATGVISTGFFQVRDDHVTVMAETLELSNEIDVGRAKRAQQKAEEALKAADLDEQAFRKYQLKLERSIVRQSLGGNS